MEEDEVGRGVWRRMRLGEGVEEDEGWGGVWGEERLGEGCGGG